MKNLHEACGLFGIYTPEAGPLAVDTYYALFALQHRGQQSAGIVVNNDGLFTVKKDEGLAGGVFTPEDLQKLGDGTMAVGHVQYSTAANAASNAQPLVVNHIKGHLALAHNGSLVNAHELRRELEMEGAIFHTCTDIEIIAHLIIRERLTAPSIEEAVNRAVRRLVGAYSLIIMSPSKLIAVRDKMAMRPLCYGTTAEPGGYAIASESCALSSVGATFVRDLLPGEILIIDKGGLRSITDHCQTAPKKTCIFEYIYFARPDSTIDGVNVHNARVKAGECLAEDTPAEADLVIGVPDSGIDAAIGYSKRSGIPYELGFYKSRYVARTFIAPTQKMRENGVRMKLSPIPDVVRGKRVVLVDDSIVRGTTSEQIVRLIRNAGASEVHMRISSPPFLNPCYYGTDIDSKDKLIACRMTLEQICRKIGADSLGFLGVHRLPDLLGGGALGDGYCDACFTAMYPTEVPEQVEPNKYEHKISEGK